MHILFWLYKSRINRRGQAPIMMRITINGQRTAFSTNIFIGPNQWDTDKQRVKGISPFTKEINNVLMNLKTSGWNHYSESIRKGVVASAQAIRESILQESKPIH